MELCARLFGELLSFFCTLIWVGVCILDLLCKKVWVLHVLMVFSAHGGAFLWGYKHSHIAHICFHRASMEAATQLYSTFPHCPLNVTKQLMWSVWPYQCNAICQTAVLYQLMSLTPFFCTHQSECPQPAKTFTLSTHLFSREINRSELSA